MAKFKIKQGDMVKVIAGKDKGRTGKVLRVLRSDARIVVEGLNMVKRHQKPTAEQPGQIVEKEAPLHISNMLPIVGASSHSVALPRVPPCSLFEAFQAPQHPHEISQQHPP